MAEEGRVARGRARGHDRKGGGFTETVKTIFYAVLIALVIRTVALEPFNIPSRSMVPTLLVGDYLFVSKYAYGYSRHSLPLGLPLFEGRVMYTQPERGDVAVFVNPLDQGKDYIKRIIGLPGDRIQVKNGILHLNGKPVPRKGQKSYAYETDYGTVVSVIEFIESLPPSKKGKSAVDHRIIEVDGDTGGADNTREFIVPKGKFFMMGDNRDRSSDSRYLNRVGFVDAENLVGRAEFIFFSVDGTARLWEVWKWPGAIRWNRLFEAID